MKTSKFVPLWIAIATVMLVSGIFAAVPALHNLDWEARHPAAKEHRLIARCDVERDCEGAFIRWTNRPEIVRLSVCNQTCGWLEDSVSAFRVGALRGFYADMDSVVLPTDLAWTWTAVQYERQFIKQP